MHCIAATAALSIAVEMTAWSASRLPGLQAFLIVRAETDMVVHVAMRPITTIGPITARPGCTMVDRFAFHGLSLERRKLGEQVSRAVAQAQVGLGQEWLAVV